jgi:hypothetical protein
VSGVEELEARLVGLRAERDGLSSIKTKEDLRGEVARWLEAMRTRYSGSARFVLGGHGSPEQAEAVLGEDRFDDAGLADRLVARLEAEGFGELSNRQRDAQRKKLDEQVAKVTGELREARRTAALAEVERQFAGEGA